MFDKDISLKPYNTFGIDVRASLFTEVTSLAQLKNALNEQPDAFILSGGSNILLVNDLKAPVIFLNLTGKELIKQTEDTIWVKAMAGENWHEFVMWCLDKGYGGLENLSLIPGNVGTSPMQNIGAYGVEIKDHFIELEAINRKTGEFRSFNKEECQFGYRDSVFKNALKDQYIIVSVVFELTLGKHQIRSEYGAIKEELKKLQVADPGIKDISDAVIRIRQSKLPDPKELGNSGSFFKNPIVDGQQFKDLLKIYPDIPHYPIATDQVKVPAGWLIEKSGFKGLREGDAGVHKRQALVLVNYGQATGSDILQLARSIQQKVESIFGIELEMEVNIIS